jgi:hypothetical protein
MNIALLAAKEGEILTNRGQQPLTRVASKNRKQCEIRSKKVS